MTNIVYAIGVEWGRPIKIGVASDVERRLRTLQAGNPEPLRVLWMWQHEDAFALESHMHSEFAPSRLASEWFMVASEDELDLAVSRYSTPARPEKDQSDEVIAAAAAAVLLVDIAARKHNLTTDLAMDHVARTTKVRRQLLWHLRYRKPKDLWVSDYQCLAHAVWKQAKLPVTLSEYGNFVPSADEMRSATLQLKVMAFGEPERLPNEPTEHNKGDTDAR